MRPWQAILLILALLFFAISSGWSPLYKLTYVLLTLFILSWVWARYSLRKLVFHRNTTNGRVQVGETFEERLMLDNTGVLPKLWVQIVDGSTLPGHRAGYVASMGGRKRAIWKARTVCNKRGRYRLGPVTATSGDPFGLFRRHKALTPAHELLVLPQVLPITNFVLFSGGLPGRGRSSLRSLQTTTNATTIPVRNRAAPWPAAQAFPRPECTPGTSSRKPAGLPPAVSETHPSQNRKPFPLESCPVLAD